MISSVQRRLVKELLMKAYTINPKCLTWPVYYLPFQESAEHVKLPVQALQQMPELPWPDYQCVVLADDYPSKFAGLNSMVAMIHDEEMDSRYNLMPKSGGIGYIHNFPLVFGSIVGSKVQIITDDVSIVHATEEYTSRLNWTNLNRFHSINKQVETIASTAPPGYQVDANGLRNYLDNVVLDPHAIKEYWMANRLGVKTDEVFGFATDILVYLSNIVMPCQYMLRTKFTDGFGFGPVRKVTRDKAIFTMIGYDRLYSIYPQHMLTGEIAPHFRRGHIRHLWKMAGIDRMHLPEDPVQRMLLSHKKKVERIYVQPAWIGPTNFRQDEVEHEILTGERVLRHL